MMVLNFQLKSISEIMDEAEYPGISCQHEYNIRWCSDPFEKLIFLREMQSLQERFGIHSNLCWKIAPFDIWAYNLETVLAEKTGNHYYQNHNQYPHERFLRYLHFRTAAWNHAEPEKFYMMRFWQLLINGDREVS